MNPATPYFIATRGSALALAQARTVKALCEGAFPELSFELKIIKTTGDKLQTASLAGSELPKGLFTKEIEEALVRGEADLAVHSLKDLPTDLPAGLELGATLERADVRDVLVMKSQAGAELSGQPGPSEPATPAGVLARLPTGSTVATSSTRRCAQLRDHRPDLNLVPIRGNVDTRLRKVAEQPELQATILAAAGLCRLGFEIRPNGQMVDHRPDSSRPASSNGLIRVRAFPMEPEEMLPCVGQATIGIEVRSDNARVRPVLRLLDHPPTHGCVLAERAFLAGLGGGCQLAVAAYAQILGQTMRLRAVSFLGQTPLHGETSGPPAEAIDLGRRLAASLAPPKN
jgi:hydroxymethylbilane synthase